MAFNPGLFWSILHEAEVQVRLMQVLSKKALRTKGASTQGEKRRAQTYYYKHKKTILAKALRKRLREKKERDARD